MIIDERIAQCGHRSYHHVIRSVIENRAVLFFTGLKISVDSKKVIEPACPHKKKHAAAVYCPFLFETGRQIVKETINTNSIHSIPMFTFHY